MLKTTKKQILDLKTRVDKVDNDATSRFHNAQTTLKNEIAKLRNETHNELVGYTRDIMAIPDLVECDICGCLLKKSTAIRGKSRVVVECNWYNTMLQYAGNAFGTAQEKIQEVYYCKCHQLKVKSKKTKSSK